MNTATLLIEFLTEELPPINLLNNIGELFANSMYEELKNFINPYDQKGPNAEIILSPRRFGTIIKNVSFTEPDTETIRKGPAINSGIIDGKPTKALEGFMSSCNITDISQLEQNDGYFYARKKIVGKDLEDILDSAINNSLKKLIIDKGMHWGSNVFSFVRPVHNLVIIHGDKIINLKEPIFGLNSVNYTLGHRFLSDDKIIISDANSYFDILKQQGKVLASFQKRREYIHKQLTEKAQELGLALNDTPGLLDEITALTEFPVILQGKFATEFLVVPQECLILSMANNQKYFALLDKSQKLSNKFLFVANMASKDPSVIINGNERVLSARLADAKFFFDVDKKNPLDFYINKLSNVVYHNQLGTQIERIERLQYIAVEFAKIIGIDIRDTQHAAYIMKADLTTEMVGEFPELQGIMGKYYALYHGENPKIANAIEKHYYPCFSGDNLPNDKLSVVLSLADRLETIVGIWGVGLIPTGDKDPFALRRMALGVVRILLEYPLNIRQLIDISFESFQKCSNIKLDPAIKNEVYQFIAQRLANYLIDSEEFSYSSSQVQSACIIQPEQFTYIPSLLNRLQQFADNANNQLFISANKRIENILGKSSEVRLPDYYHTRHVGIRVDEERFSGGSDTLREVDTLLFQSQIEQDLYDKVKDNLNILDIVEINWEHYFKILEEFNPIVAAFFDNVMVMDENKDIRLNRIRLLAVLYEIMNKYCKISELST
ncbi:MAG: glycine--tRNA ligase subunit beta [Neisseriaceae bacterium]